jgi:membrane-bound lytic murein transglycosylase A
LMAHLQPWRVESTDGSAEGLATGYFEPTIDAQRRPRGSFRVPLYAPPPDLASYTAARKPYFTRQQLDTLPAAMASLRGREIAWIEDPLDALLLQVQGSGRLRFTEADGRVSTVRLAFAAHNEHPYRSLGRWLIEQGELTAEMASWPAIKAWAQRYPRRVNELLWANPRVVFFREEALPDTGVGPRGAQGVPLTPGRSVAIDPQAVPHGAVLWLDTTEPLSATPLRRLVMAQDSGSAITGAVRVDLFFGWQPGAEQLAGRMKQPLRLWVLWPRGAAPPEGP